MSNKALRRYASENTKKCQEMNKYILTMNNYDLSIKRKAKEKELYEKAVLARGLLKHWQYEDNMEEKNESR